MPEIQRLTAFPKKSALGEGTSEKIFSGVKDNSRKYDEVFESLLDVISRQRVESEGRMSGIAQRYAPKRRLK